MMGGMPGQAPVMVVNQNAQRETGRKAQLGNITAAKAVSDIVRTTLGPRSMLKMLLDAQGSIVLTNDGNAILREIDVAHPAAKSMVDLSRAQDEEVGDGTTSVIILAGEMLHCAVPFLDKKLHPTVIIRGYLRALEDAIAICDELCYPIAEDDEQQLSNIVQACVGTKFTTRFGTLISDLAIQAVQTVRVELPGGGREIDVKKYAKIEKIPGGSLEDCRVLKGVLFAKDVVAPGRMPRKIERPRILLLDCPLEYKKGENQTNVEISKEEDWAALLKAEEAWISARCNDIIKAKPDLVITEKGLSDFAVTFLARAGISAIRRLRKTDNNRIARACGATVVHRTDEIKDSDIGTGAGVFEVKKIGDEYFSFIVDCDAPKACTVLLRGASKDILNEVERNLHDAMGVARNVVQDPRLLPGGGATEMAVATRLQEKAASVPGVEAWPYRALGAALEVIPRTLAQNCGANVIRTITKLRAKHLEGEGAQTFGIDGNAGTIVDMKELGVWEPYAVKTQTFKTSLEAAVLLLRIDDILSGLSHKGGARSAAPQKPTTTTGDDVDSEQQLAE